MEHKLLLFRCRCNKLPRTATKAAELRVKKAGKWHHVYLYCKTCGNVEFVFKFYIDPVGALIINEYPRTSPIPSDFLRGGEGDALPILAEEYMEWATKQFEEDLDKDDEPGP